MISLKINRIIFSAIFILLFLFLAKPTFAANDNFSTSAKVTYAVNASGVTHVVFNDVLTNSTEKYYVTSYQIHLGFHDIQNLQASENGAALTPSLSSASSGEDVSLSFPTPVIGKGKAMPFVLSFDTNEVASLNGSIWEVNIPGLSHADDFTNFSVQLIVPPYFGSPRYIKPASGDSSLIFTKEELGKSGISLAFGDKQVYAFTLGYNIANAQLFPVHTEVALPPNTTYQHVEIDSISPRPDNVTMDTDGNWLAQYHLAPSQKMKITATGKAYLSLEPSLQSLSQSLFSEYLRPTQYWEANNDNIKKLATTLKTPEAIFTYVVNHLQYNFAKISDTQDRLGAVGVLADPTNAVCLEFTDLFIALSRAAGIPARGLDGYGYTQNTSTRPLSLQKEVLHAWPEYYDIQRKTWIMVDPTWENTTGGVDYFHTFDFDHVTLAIKGVSSVYPIPAGGYKLPGQENEKDVLMSFAKDSVEPQPAATIQLAGPSEYTAGLPMYASFAVTNTGLVAFPSEVAKASLLGNVQQYAIATIPPFGTSTYSMNLGKTSFLTNITSMITIRVGSETITKSVHITTFSLPVIIGGVIFVIFCFIISIIATRSRRLSIPQ